MGAIKFVNSAFFVVLVLGNFFLFYAIFSTFVYRRLSVGGPGGGGMISLVAMYSHDVSQMLHVYTQRRGSCRRLKDATTSFGSVTALHVYRPRDIQPCHAYMHAPIFPFPIDRSYSTRKVALQSRRRYKKTSLSVDHTFERELDYQLPARTINT